MKLRSAAALPNAGPTTVLQPISSPVAPSGRHLLVLRGSLAPDGAVTKLGGLKVSRFEGPARVFDSEADAFTSIMAGGTVCKGDVVIVRYEVRTRHHASHEMQRDASPETTPHAPHAPHHMPPAARAPAAAARRPDLLNLTCWMRPDLLRRGVPSPPD